MLNRLFEEQKSALVAIGALVVLAFSTLVVVPETQQAVVMRLGEPQRVINRFRPGDDFGNTGAGLTWRIPIMETMVRIDKRMLTVPMERQQVLSIDQQPLEVDAYARFRIIDPARMVRSAGSSDRVVSALQPIFSSVLRQELGKRTFQSLLTAERGQAMVNIRNNLDKQAREYGAQVIDVRIKSADLPAGTPLDSAFARMTAAKDQEAATIIAEGQKNAQLIRADAQAQSAQIYANSFGKDAQFYDFWRAMQSYDATFSNQKNPGRSTIILSPDSDYLRQFKGR
ncbi:protease modulator HflC [Novosphingobium sp. TH158]|uniref:protease modulator HflC n=1 Tax=Novosphingobium sp. TH158 TaxID=2067455 RepID=UPI000C795B14|nr:protease modulator HflC [Novosphingobium sp. TH158]PLK24427.1 protease modulator HflC [Novosphingobium sp. TH158]